MQKKLKFLKIHQKFSFCPIFKKVHSQSPKLSRTLTLDGSTLGTFFSKFHKSTNVRKVSWPWHPRLHVLQPTDLSANELKASITRARVRHQGTFTFKSSQGPSIINWVLVKWPKVNGVLIKWHQRESLKSSQGPSIINCVRGFPSDLAVPRDALVNFL